MDINETPEMQAFRARVREWIETRVPPQLKGLRQSIVQGPGLSAEEMQPLEDALAARAGRRRTGPGSTAGRASTFRRW